MTQQQSPRPVDEFAAAIYETVRLDENAESDALVLQYRDKLTELSTIRERHDQFVAVYTGRSPTSASQPLPIDAELTKLFREACTLLSGEQLATFESAELHRRLDNQIVRLCQYLARVFFLRLENELEAGRVGQFRSFNTKMGRCTLPMNARGRQFDSPFAAMMSGLDADDEPESDRRSMTSVIEFLIDEDLPLANNRRLVRQFRPVQLMVEQSTPPIREFLRFVSGNRYRETDDLAHGRFTAIVFFHYVVDSWSDDAPKVAASARHPTSRSWMRMPNVSAWPVALALSLLVAVFCVDRTRQAKITALEQRIARLETKPVRLAEPVTLESPRETAAVGAIRGELRTLNAEVNYVRAELADLREITNRPQNHVRPPRAEEPPVERVRDTAAAVEQRRIDEIIQSLAAVSTVQSTQQKTVDRLSDLIANADAKSRRSAEQDALRQQETASQIDALRKSLASISNSIPVLVTSSQEHAATFKRVDSGLGEIQISIKQVRTDVDRLDSLTQEKFKLLSPLFPTGAKIADSDAVPLELGAGNSIEPFRLAKHLILMDVERISQTNEPYELEYRPALIEHRWNVLWAASASEPFVMRASLLLDEISRVDQCAFLNKDLHERTLTKRFACLSDLKPDEREAHTADLVALTQRALKLYRKDPYPNEPKREMNRHAATFIGSVGAFVETRRRASLSHVLPKSDQPTRSQPDDAATPVVLK